MVRRASLAGCLAAAVGLATTVLLEGLFMAVPSLVAVVGQATVRSTPGFLSRGAIDAVGTADKPLLLVIVVALALAIGARAGLAARRRRWVGDLTFAAAGLFAVLCATTLGHVETGPVVASAAFSATAGALALRRLLAAAEEAARPPAEAPSAEAPAGVDAGGELAPGPGVGDPSAWPGERSVGRRRFLLAGSVAGGATAAALGGGWVFRRALGRESPRASINLPAAKDPAMAGAPASRGFMEVDGLSPLVTPNSDFYRIDEALVVPSVDADRWRMRVTGMVDQPFELTYDELLGEPLVERYVTLSCVSNEVGGTLVDNARWLGVPLARLLDRAGARPGATQVVGRSVDGFTAGFPVEVATDGRDALVAVGMNGEPLPLRHGFPARLVVPGLYGFVSATKWLQEIELTTFEDFDAYWVERGWAREGPVKVQSRIDVPGDRSHLEAGSRVVAGVAWAPNTGIDRVEVRVDDGDWSEAAIGPQLGADSWCQWSWPWDADPGDHDITVRAATSDGEVQTASRQKPFPNGATGHHRVTVRVT